MSRNHLEKEKVSNRKKKIISTWISIYYLISNVCVSLPSKYVGVFIKPNKYYCDDLNSNKNKK